MAKKPMTKSQIVSHFAGKFELSKKTSAMSSIEGRGAGGFRNQEDRLLYPSWNWKTGPR